MILRFAALLFAALLLLAATGSAQTAAEFLQKGIYTQQTAGNVDGAIEIYRQVIGMAGTDRATAGRAQMQLVSAFLQKGDFPGASREFNTLMLNYADQKELVSAMSTAMRMAASIRVASVQTPPRPPQLTKGTLQNGVYHHNTTGTEVRLPQGWSVTGDSDSSGGGEAVMLKDPSGQAYFMWLIPSSITVETISQRLDEDSEYKFYQRTMEGDGGFKLRPGTLVKWGSGTRQGLTAAFDFTQGSPQIEYASWMRSAKTALYFRVYCTESNVSAVRDSLRLLQDATTLP